MLTEKDIANLEKRLKETFPTRDEFLEYRSDIMDKLNSILKEIVTSRQEQIILAHKSADHEDRITVLEAKN